MATTTKGLTLPCPLCGEQDACVKLHLADPDAFTCDECGEEFDRAMIDSLLRRWTAVLKWVDAMPVMEE